MEEGRLHQIVSKYLPEGETYRFSSVKCSNVLCKEELVLKYPDHSWLFELAFNIIDASKELHPIPEDFNFVIGDFSPNNIIVNNGDLAAFIDLEYFMLGNRYHDFILMHGYFEQDEEIKTSFFEGYMECLNNDHFKFSADKMMISLLKYSLECCFIANPKTIDVAVKKLMAVVKKFIPINKA